MSIFLYLYLYKYKEIKILSHPKFSSVKSQRRVFISETYLVFKVPAEDPPQLANPSMLVATNPANNNFLFSLFFLLKFDKFILCKRLHYHNSGGII